MSPDGRDEWLDLEYAEPVLPIAILVYETFNPGALCRVSVSGQDGKEVEVWTEKPGPLKASKRVTVVPTKVDFPTDRVMLHIASNAVPGWNEIDAVGIVDISGKTHWAVVATASSTFAEQQPARFVVEPDRLERLESEVRQLRNELRQVKEDLKK